MSTILERVVQVLAEQCELEAGSVTEETALHSLGIDSLTMLETGFALQREFGSQVDDDAVADAETIGDLVRAVEVCLAAP